MMRWIVMSIGLWLWVASAQAQPTVIIVQGAAGEEAYGRQFAQWRERWEQAAGRGGARVVVIGAAQEEADRSDKVQLKQSIESLAKQGEDGKASTEPVWLVLLGHGTYDGKSARFNLRGPDLSAEELSQWLKPVQRPTAIVNCSSSSGPFMSALTGADRVIVTATRSGHELNFSRFGDFLSQAVADASADLDKDGQTSLLEAYLLASRRTQEWYREEGRLATEHALLDDNGDGLGTPADWFRGVRAVRRAKEGGRLDGLRAAQWLLVPGESERTMPADRRARRDALELEIARLREMKSSTAEEEYYAALERLLVPLARLHAEDAGN